MGGIQMVMNGGHDGELQDGSGGDEKMVVVVGGDGVVGGGGGGGIGRGLRWEKRRTKEERVVVVEEEEGSELIEKGKVGKLDTRREKARGGEVGAEGNGVCGGGK
ncbi:hypothetical protein BO83DRAFT_12951 [Aspergillus eucalypticola CBS 122712]|uniref:Uncharacterized protein n=1 Tax=Aspergillus eucalypticola (strain CBS 122712 / IBT 29274) TaxID=1448314 RepID=A0A317VRZ4_ASPEC|nr:uncharacterized protein BO83DRAFT_12951 [Aspergillus eucalypticola CBS 122712]PWY74670.1 hypothetical protein BO83DRAFT_12951 [Aspergillus eucalypticola CBS 122712]